MISRGVHVMMSGLTIWSVSVCAIFWKIEIWSIPGLYTHIIMEPDCMGRIRWRSWLIWKGKRIIENNFCVVYVYVDVDIWCIRFSYQEMGFPDVEELRGMMGKDYIWGKVFSGGMCRMYACKDVTNCACYFTDWCNIFWTIKPCKISFSFHNFYLLELYPEKLDGLMIDHSNLNLT